MMYKIRPTSRFQKDLKRLRKRGYDMDLLTGVLKQLAAGQALAPSYRDHPWWGITAAAGNATSPPTGC